MSRVTRVRSAGNRVGITGVTNVCWYRLKPVTRATEMAGSIVTLVTADLLAQLGSGTVYLSSRCAKLV